MNETGSPRLFPGTDFVWRGRIAFAWAVAASLAAFAVSLAVGPTEIAFRSFAEALFRYDPLDEMQFVIREIRLPRALLALIVGGSLAGAGAAMQGVTRNPLAGPSIMGLSGGGSLAALIALIAVPGLSYNGAIAASFGGAALGYGGVLAVACLSPDGFSPARLALAGVVVSALLSAITQGLLIAFAMQGDMLYWTMGGIANVSWPQVSAAAPFCLVGLVGLMWLAPNITILSLGKVMAVGLGQHPGRIHVAVTLCVLLLAGAAVAVAGPVGFVGLMVPHACRALAGADYRRLIPLSVVVGAALTGFADLGARTVFGLGGEMPLGVVTAVVGAPALVWLIRRGIRERLDKGAPTSPVSATHRSPRRVLPSMIGVLLLLIVGAVEFGGCGPFSPGKIFQALFGVGGMPEQMALWSFRLPRIAFALLVGAGIAVSGAVIQGIFRNDLAEPGILGISAGASMGIVLMLGMFGGYAGLHSVCVLPLAAMGGALAAILLVCALCLGASHAPLRLLLTGVAVSSALGAITLFISMQISSEAYSFAVAFSAGSLGAADWNYVFALVFWLGLLLPLLWTFAPALNVLRLGEPAAVGLGVRVPAFPFLLLALAVAVCAACMALAGGLLFLGLIAPHIARRLVGSDHGIAIPVAGLAGAALLILADLLACRILPSTEIPAGVMVSALGAPYFLYLLMRRGSGSSPA